MKKQKPLKRGAGVLLPVTSLPGEYGIGSLGREAYRFVDWLKKAGQSYWQVLPLGPTSYGDSPYQSFSAFAGSPYLIDLETLCKEGLLEKKELSKINFGSDPTDIDYAALYQQRFPVLRKAFLKSKVEETPAYKAFLETHGFWLSDYCLFMAIKNQQGGKSWQEWPDELRLREKGVLEKAEKALSEDCRFWAFCQFLFFSQWHKLKAYANQKGIEIIGDIPIYVAMDSADVWVNGDLFQLDKDRRPLAVAGVPPDLFSTTGQLWGNPLYQWDKMKENNFSWWQQRMGAQAGLYDLIRIDHFIGVVNYYSIPAKDLTAENGHWEKGPGEALLEAITPALSGKKIIAEDLGVVTAPVVRLKKKCGYPGMKLMQFGFDSDAKNGFLPCNFERNQVIYAGTHDNETLRGYFKKRPRKELQYAREYLNVKRNSEIPEALIRAGYESSANTAIYLMQDLLGLENNARINTPSTIGENWRWRMQANMLTDSHAEALCHMMQIYGR